LAIVIPGYDAQRVYRENEIVVYDNVLYLSKSVQSNKLPTDTDYWELFQGDLMARKTTRISGADFVVSKTTPVEILAQQPVESFVSLRSLTVELVAGEVVFADGGALQIVVGGAAAVDLPADATLYSLTEDAVQVIDLAGVLTAPITVADIIDGGISLKLKTADIDDSGGVAAVTIADGGTGYAVGDTGTITAPGLGIDAEYIVTSVSTGVVTGLSITATGSGHAVDTAIATAATTGSGNDDLTVNITALSWDGELKVTLYYSLLPIG